LIKFVKYKNVDLKKWDSCVRKSINKDVTALSGYLDIACKKWDALILDDYKAVMPLPKNRRIFFNNYSTNFLVPQLGIYGNNISLDTLSGFLKQLKRKSYSLDYKLNKYNYKNKLEQKLKRTTAYEFDIYSKENIQISKKYYCKNRISNNEIIKFIENNTIISNINISDFNPDIFRKILAYTIRRGIAYYYTAYDNRNNIIGFAFFIKSFSKDKLIFTAIREKNTISEIFKFLLNCHLIQCRQNISIDLGYSSTYFNKLFNLSNAKPYFIQTIVSD
jgi:hypothetical protein